MKSSVMSNVTRTKIKMKRTFSENEVRLNFFVTYTSIQQKKSNEFGKKGQKEPIKTSVGNLKRV
jgi:hypothetical protein